MIADSFIQTRLLVARKPEEYLPLTGESLIAAYSTLLRILNRKRSGVSLLVDPIDEYAIT